MKTSLDGSNSRLDMIKQRSVNMDGEESIELIESEEPKRKKRLEAKNSLWDNIKWLNMYVIGVPGGLILLPLFVISV